MLQDFFEDILDNELEQAVTQFPYCTPTKEAYAYRCMYESHFPGRAEIIPGFWQPKWDAKGKVKRYVDPSVRTLGL